MDVDLFLRRVVFLARNFGDYSAENIVKLCLQDMEMDAGLDGFQYLIFCSVYYHNNPNATFTKHVYPAAAKAFGCRHIDVEIAIRRAIRSVWQRKCDGWYNYFSDGKVPSNGAFISIISEVLNFWEYFKNNQARTQE